MWWVYGGGGGVVTSVKCSTPVRYVWSRGARLSMQRLTSSCLLRGCVNVGYVFVLGDVFHDEVFVIVL